MAPCWPVRGGPERLAPTSRRKFLGAMSDARLAALHHAPRRGPRGGARQADPRRRVQAPPPRRSGRRSRPAPALLFDCHSELECCRVGGGRAELATSGCGTRAELRPTPACCDVDARAPRPRRRRPPRGGARRVRRQQPRVRLVGERGARRARRLLPAARGVARRVAAEQFVAGVRRRAARRARDARRAAEPAPPARRPPPRRQRRRARRRARRRVVETLRRELRDGGATAEGAAAACDAGAVLRAAEPRCQRRRPCRVGSLVNMNTFVPSLIFLMTLLPRRLAESASFPIATLPILKWLWLFMGVVSLMASGRQPPVHPVHAPAGRARPPLGAAAASTLIDRTVTHASSPNGFTPGGNALALGLAPSKGSTCRSSSHLRRPRVALAVLPAPCSPNGLANGLGAAD